MSQAVPLWRRTQETLKPYATIPLRLIVGYGFLSHGLAKWNRGPDAFAAILAMAHVPAPHLMAALTILIEIFGGLAILCGAFVSLVAIPAIGLLVVAILTVHLPYGFSSIKLLKVVDGRAQFGPPGYECNLLYIACIVALVMAGPSPWSVDRWLLRREATRPPPKVYRQIQQVDSLPHFFAALSRRVGSRRTCSLGLSVGYRALRDRLPFFRQ